ncbi:MAG TPA: hypothetical protein PLG09_08875 [Syntrophomonadaceae bacterium]|jgi:hypothetical protein|nr:hypothetical protein [Syntrophomonadaceae bacterium]HOQ10221.1 hypothetical protein [Syntrophomonadaceae bacterium]HPU49311.1 hypothetical protein [Syntrophomonadaceae bacterium]HQD90781.1 hypothetical protein [Syntrophomonadaceae bacterium]
MPKYTAILALLVLMSIVAAGCQALSQPESQGEQEQYPAGEITIAGINLGDRGDKVKEILGDDYTSAPLHADGSWFGEPTTRWLYGGDLEVIIGEESNTVLQVNLYGDGYSTSRGDRVGDRADKVLPVYEREFALAKDHFEGRELPGWFVIREGEWLIFNFQDDGTMVNQVIDDDEPVVSIHLVYEKFMD